MLDFQGGTVNYIIYQRVLVYDYICHIQHNNMVCHIQWCTPNDSITISWKNLVFTEG